MEQISAIFHKPFLLNWKRILAILVSGVLFIVLHNLVSAAIGVEEGFFFTLTVIIVPLYLLVAVIYTIAYYLKTTEKQ